MQEKQHNFVVPSDRASDAPEPPLSLWSPTTERRQFVVRDLRVPPLAATLSDPTTSDGWQAVVDYAQEGHYNVTNEQQRGGMYEDMEMDVETNMDMDMSGDVVEVRQNNNEKSNRRKDMSSQRAHHPVLIFLAGMILASVFNVVALLPLCRWRGDERGRALYAFGAVVGVLMSLALVGTVAVMLIGQE